LAVAAGIAGLTRHGALEALLELAAGRAAIVIIPVAVVAIFGAFRDSVAALLTGCTRHRAREALLHAALRVAAVAIIGIAVVAFLVVNERPIAARWRIAHVSPGAVVVLGTADIDAQGPGGARRACGTATAAIAPTRPAAAGADRWIPSAGDENLTRERNSQEKAKS
jgi:hypothetical protein